MLSKIFYTTNFIPARFAGITYGPFVLIRPSHKDDVGLRKHELTHVKQFWNNPLFGIFYKFSKTSRLKYEAEAYKMQLTCYPTDKTDLFAQYLVDNYNLDITFEQAKAALK